jgi:hypothetical protein
VHVVECAGQWSFGVVHRSVFNKYYLFQVFNVFLGSILASGILAGSFFALLLFSVLFLFHVCFVTALTLSPLLNETALSVAASAGQSNCRHPAAGFLSPSELMFVAASKKLTQGF